MKTIKELINKILWDKKEDPEDYVLYYHDRVRDIDLELPFKAIKNIDGNFLVVDKEGKDGTMEEAEIPMHKVRFVKKKGIIVWKRP